MADEPKIGANRGNAGKGRPKGAANKTTAIAKDALSYAFNKLGGQDGLVKWASANEENRKIFYQTIWPKLLPLQMTGEDGGPLQVIIQKPSA